MESFWSGKTNPPIKDLASDIVIVGGGFVGFSAAYWLREIHPDLKITLIDRSFCGAGASGRNAGFLTKGSVSFYHRLSQKWGRQRALDIFKFASQSIQLTHERLLASSPSLVFDECSSLTLFKKKDSFKNDVNHSFSPADFQFEWMGQDNLPGVLRDVYGGGYKSEMEFKINPMELLGSFRQHLENKNIRIIEGLSAFELMPSGVKTNRNKIRTQKVVLALNGYLPQLDDRFRGIISPRRAQMMAVEIENHPYCPDLYYDSTEGVYWRMIDKKRLIIGGKRKINEAEEVGEFDKVTPLVQNALENYLHQLGFKFKIISRWAGTMGFTSAELPMIELLESPLETVVVGGFSGHGMGLGFLSGKEAAEMIMRKKKESFFSFLISADKKS